MTILQEDVDFLEHYGVKGMRWGVRKKETGQNFVTRGIQKRVDRTQKIADGTATKRDKVVSALDTTIVTKKGAARSLRRLKAFQKQVEDGDARVQNMLLRMQGVNVSALRIQDNSPSR